MGLPKKGEAWIVYRFKGGGGAGQERGCGVFEGWSVDTPMRTMMNRIAYESKRTEAEL